MLESCLSLCDPIVCSQSDSSVCGTLQARILGGLPCHLQGIFLTQASDPRLLLFLHCQAGFGPLCLLRGQTLSYNPALLWHSESTEHLRLQLGACGIRTDGAFAFRSLQTLLHQSLLLTSLPHPPTVRHTWWMRWLWECGGNLGRAWSQEAPPEWTGEPGGAAAGPWCVPWRHVAAVHHQSGARPELQPGNQPPHKFSYSQGRELSVSFLLS